MAPGGTLFRFPPHFGENVLLHGSHEWLPYSKDEVRLKTVNNNLSALQVGDWNLTASFLISGGGWHIMKSKIRAFGRRGKEAV